jgi:GntR family transcriptional regulator of vanillate catabolism
MAANYVAKQGLSSELAAALKSLLDHGDELIAKGFVEAEDESLYASYSADFHGLVVANCGSAPLMAAIEKVNNMPFIAPSIIDFSEVGLQRAYVLLVRAHGLLHAIYDALLDGDGARAESLYKEHGFAQRGAIKARLKRSGAHG